MLAVFLLDTPARRGAMWLGQTEYPTMRRQSTHQLRAYLADLHRRLAIASPRMAHEITLEIANVQSYLAKRA